MSTVSMDLIKKLRDRTQVGMMDCKKALEDAHGDFDAAVEILRKKGAAVAAKRAENATNNGRIEAFVAADAKSGAMVQSACETDFSANTQAMQTFLHDVAQHVVATNPSDIETLHNQSFVNNSKLTIRQLMDELIAKICESTKISNFVRFQASNNGLVHAYIHPGSTVGVLVHLETNKDSAAHLEQLKTVAKDVCMQIAVTNPLCLQPSQLDQATLERERALAQEQLKDSNKPANVIEKIIDGKMSKFYQDACLLNQAFIKDEKSTVQQYLDANGKTLGATITITAFKRFAIGR